LFSIGLIAVYAIASLVITRVYFRWADVAKRIN